jgi:chitinase
VGSPFYGYGWIGVPDANNGLYQTSTGPAPSPAGVATFLTLQSLTSFERHYDPKRIAQWIYDPATLTFYDPSIAWAKPSA